MIWSFVGYAQLISTGNDVKNFLTKCAIRYDLLVLQNCHNRLAVEFDEAIRLYEYYHHAQIDLAQKLHSLEIQSILLRKKLEELS